MSPSGRRLVRGRGRGRVRVQPECIDHSRPPSSKCSLSKMST